jgi:hypothetical protein
MAAFRVFSERPLIHRRNQETDTHPDDEVHEGDHPAPAVLLVKGAFEPVQFREETVWWVHCPATLTLHGGQTLHGGLKFSCPHKSDN